MKKMVLTLGVVFMAVMGVWGQDVKIKKNTVLVDGKEDSYLTETRKNYYTLKSLESDEDLAFLRFTDKTSSYSSFNDSYFTFIFPDHDEEIEYKTYKLVDAVKLLYSKDVIENGKVNIDKLNDFVKLYLKKP